MKRHLLIIISYIIILWSCVNKKQQNGNTLLGDGAVTFVLKDFPEKHGFDDDIYISGNFEGWSGGREQFKLQKDNNQYRITIPEYKETLSFKFTQGYWDSVECALNGKPIENRLYIFKDTDETVTVNIVNWNDTKHQNKPSTASKNVQVFDEEFNIPQLNRKRKISVYLPPNYQTSNEHYPVLYIQDGQNVFDVKTSYSGEWEIDETLNDIYSETGFGLIVVAIDHSGEKRLNEYSPWDHKKHGKGEGEAYVDFLVNTLKPEIDKAFRTKRESENTVIMGSSLGGLISHYAAFARPDVFGKAGVFSPSFWYAEDIFRFTKNKINPAKTSKIFFLAGNKEGENMVENVTKMTNLLKDNGFPETQIHSKIVSTGTHSESFWKGEFEDAIRWLFSI